MSMWATLEDYGRRTYRFVRRHRTPILLGTVAVGVGAVVYFRASQFLDEVNELRDEMETSLRLRRKRARQLERTKFESRRAVESFLPSLKARFAVLIDTNGVIHQLKASREQKSPGYKQKRLEMWEELKTSSFVRYVAMLYALSMLNLLLLLQMHVLGRQTFLAELRRQRDGQEAPDEEEPMDVTDRHRLLSVTYEYLLGDGLRGLVDACRDAVEQCLKDWTVATKKQVPFEDLKAVLTEIRAHVETTAPQHSSDSTAIQSSPLLRFLIRPDARTADMQSSCVRVCLQETWDLAQSPLFLAAMKDALAKAFDVALSAMQQLHFLADAPPDQQSGQPQITEAIFVQQPLAQIITAFQKETTKFLGTLPDGQASATSALYIDEISNLDTVNALCAAAFGVDEAT
mmetsp:Transcript_12655/g.46739  ORF Transcript_12655/g.46739 Transcript_12655/m.46739 type:complete len:402 (-) Transcript_12655:1492-2697(-)